MTSPRCFLIEPMTKHSASEALIRQYGEIVYVFHAEDKNRPSVFDGERFSSEVLQRLRRMQFDAEVDFVVVGGAINSIVHLIAMAMCIDFSESVVRALMFCQSDQRYVSVELG